MQCDYCFREVRATMMWQEDYLPVGAKNEKRMCGRCFVKWLASRTKAVAPGL